MQNRHTLILGKSGTGKSYLVKKAMSSGRLGGRVMVVDIKGAEYADVPGFERITEIGDAIDQARAEDFEVFSWRFVPDTDADVSDIFRLALAVKHCTVIAEEIGDYKADRHLLRCLRRGRSEGVRVIALSQRPAEVHRTVSSQCELTVAFHMDDSRDREYVRDRYGDSAVVELASIKDIESREVCLWGQTDLFAETFGPINERAIP